MNATLENKQGKKIAQISTAAYVVLCALFLFTLKCEQNEESSNMGIMVNLGTTDTGMNEDNIPTAENTIEPQETNPEPVQESQQAEAEIESVTQEIEDVAVTAATKPNTNSTNNNEQSTENTKPEPQPDPKPAVNENALFSGNNNANQGTGNTSGDQGNPDGNLESDIYGDIAGNGLGSGGKGWGLKGRGLVSKPSPTNPTNEYGNVTIKITVDKHGTVTNAEFTSFNSTTTNRDLVALAIKEAYKVKFNNVVSDNKARDKQIGYVVFKFQAN
ncbi:MAG: hypothetical protein R2836_04390 [Chitinophagales bacterium]